MYPRKLKSSNIQDSFPLDKTGSLTAAKFPDISRSFGQAVIPSDKEKKARQIADQSASCNGHVLQSEPAVVSEARRLHCTNLQADLYPTTFPSIIRSCTPAA